MLSLRPPRTRAEDGSVIVVALLVMAIMVPLGLALLAIVDTQAKESGNERGRDRVFNLADSALSSAAFSLGRSGWPNSPSTAPSNAGAVGTADVCANASYGATLGAATNAGSATSRLQPNLNASFDDSVYTSAAWQINVCDDDPATTAWDDALLNNLNYDANANRLVWVRAQSTLGGRKRVLAAQVRVSEIPALSSKYGLMTGRMNAELTNTVGTVLSSGLLGGLVSGLLGSDGLVAADPAAPAPASGVTALRCGALDGCLTGALAATGSVSLVNALITDGKLVQATSPMATSSASVAQLKQQAIASGTYVASTAGSSTTGTTAATVPPNCTIPAAASADTIVYIETVGNGDQYCLLDVASTKAYKALVIGSGRIVLRGNNTITATSATATTNTFRGLLYALNEQRATLGDAALPAREVIRLDRGAHVYGGVAADGKSAQVGVYPPGLCTTSLNLLGIDVGCALSGVTSMLGLLNTYNPAIQSNVALMNAVKVYSSAGVVRGTFRDLAGELK